MRRPRYRTAALISLVILLSLSACSSSDPLAGTAWQLSTFGSTRVMEGTTITATFKDGQIGGTAGCNHYGGEYKVKGAKLTFGALAMTEMYCMDPAGVMDQEAMYLSWLGAAERFEVKGGQLLIYRADGEALAFTAQE
jgi:heat shock protein HslJ